MVDEMIKEKNNKSLCENSMKMAASIIKMSSFSIAQMSLGASGPSTRTKNPAPASDSATDNPPLHQSDGSQRSEKPQSSSKPISFLMQPPGENETSVLIHHMIHESDDTFTYYIEKVCEKNQKAIS